MLNFFSTVRGFFTSRLSNKRVLEREDLTAMLEQSSPRTVSFDHHETMLLTNILGLRDITAVDVMVPRADIVSADSGDGIKAIFTTIVEANHSRVPVCRGSLDEVLGFLHIKDVALCLTQEKLPTLDSLLRQPMFVAPTIRALDLLHEMRLKHLHLALVVDEYGGIDGLITIEDLVEQIVGEINDEHDTDAPPMLQMNPDGTITVESRAEIGAFEAVAGISFSGEDMDEIDTIGGLVTAIAGRVPSRGEIIRHPNGLEFEILESQPRHVNLIKVCGIKGITHGNAANTAKGTRAKDTRAANTAKDTRAKDTRVKDTGTDSKPPNDQS